LVGEHAMQRVKRQAYAIVVKLATDHPQRGTIGWRTFATTVCNGAPCFNSFGMVHLHSIGSPDGLAQLHALLPSLPIAAQSA
jgi:hypothetical protein